MLYTGDSCYLKNVAAWIPAIATAALGNRMNVVGWQVSTPLRVQTERT